MKKLFSTYLSNLVFGLPYYIFLSAVTTPVALKYEESMSIWFITNLAVMCLVSPILSELIYPGKSEKEDGGKN